VVGIIFMKSHLVTAESDVIRSSNKKKEIDDFMNSIIGLSTKFEKEKEDEEVFYIVYRYYLCFWGI
jgi:hypothetical protein